MKKSVLFFMGLFSMSIAANAADFEYKCGALVGNWSNLSGFRLVLNETSARVLVSSSTVQLDGVRSHDSQGADRSKVGYLFRGGPNLNYPPNFYLIATLEEAFLNDKIASENYIFRLELTWSNNRERTDKYGCIRK